MKLPTKKEQAVVSKAAQKFFKSRKMPSFRDFSFPKKSERGLYKCA